MAEMTDFSIQIDRSLKDEADKVFSALGMNLTTAITVFVRQSVIQQKIPFDITLDTDVTLTDAMTATKRIWQASEQNGTDKMCMEDIDAEIKAARMEKKARSKAVL